MDFDRGSVLAKLLEDFMVEMNLYARDLCFRHSVLYTYEHDDSLVRSWLDHIRFHLYLNVLFNAFQLILPLLADLLAGRMLPVV